jgi:hypothetical protein
MKKDELLLAVQRAEEEDALLSRKVTPEWKQHPYGDSFTGMLCDTMVTRTDEEGVPYGDQCGLPSSDPIHVGSTPLDPWDHDELLSGGETEEMVEAVIERHAYAEPLPVPAHPLDRKRGPKMPVRPSRVAVIHTAPAPLRLVRRGR